MRIALWATLLATGCVVQADVDDHGDGPSLMGGLDVSWQVGASGCDAAGVQTIRVEDGDLSFEAACSAGAMSLDVDIGTYDLSLTGLDAGGRARYTGEASTVRVESGEVTTVPTVVLEALPADLTVTWYFDNGRLCGGNDVADIDLTLFDDDTIVESLTTTCDDGVESMPAVQSGSYTLSVMGRDGDGQIKYGATRELDLDKGDAVTVEVMLEPW